MTLAIMSRPEGFPMAAEKPFKIELPDGERGRSADDLRLLDEINARIAKPPARRNGMTPDKAREADLKARAALERAPRDKAEQGEVKGGIEESAQLAEARGHEVRRLASGALKNEDHDQLGKLLEAGKLTVDQERAGREMVEYYERRDKLGSQMGGIGGTSSPTYDNSATIFYGVQTGKSLQRIPVIEREIAMQCVDEPMALTMLRWVCERQHNVRDFTGAGRAYERGVKALAKALDVADAVIRGR